VAGSFKVRLYDRAAGRRLPRPRTEHALPLSALQADAVRAPAGEAWPGEAVAWGVWQPSNGGGAPAAVTYLGGALLLGYRLGERAWELRQYERTAWGSDGAGSLQPTPVARHVASGAWPRGRDAQYAAIGDGQLLSFEMATCNFQVVRSPHDATTGVANASGAAFEAPLLASGSLCTAPAQMAPVDARGKVCAELAYGAVEVRR